MKRKSKYRFPPVPMGKPRPPRPDAVVPGSEDLAELPALAPEVFASATRNLKPQPRPAEGSSGAPAQAMHSQENGDEAEVRRMLTAQAATLDQMFHHLAQIVLTAKAPQEQAMHYARLALKAQMQSAQTLRTLAQLGQRPRVAASRPTQAVSHSAPRTSPQAIPRVTPVERTPAPPRRPAEPLRERHSRHVPESSRARRFVPRGAAASRAGLRRAS